MAATAGPWVGEWRPHRPRGPISGTVGFRKISSRGRKLEIIFQMDIL